MKKLKYGSKKHLAFLLMACVVNAILFGAMTLKLSEIVDYGSAGDLNAMLRVLPTFLFIIIANFTNDLLQLIAKTNYIKQSVKLLKEAYLEALMEQDITQLQKEFTTTYRSQLTQDMDRYETRFFEQVVNLFSMGSTLIVAIIILLTVNLWLGVAAALLITVFIAISLKSGQPLQKSESKKSESLNTYTAFLEESLNGFEVVKQYQLEEDRITQFSKHANQVQQDNYAIDVKATYVDALNIFIQMMVIFVASAGALLFARSAGAGMGSIVSVLLAFSNVVWPMQQIAPTLTQMVGIQEVLTDFDKALKHTPHSRTNTVQSYEALSFNHNDLGYDTPILSDVNLSIKKNEKVLIIGQSGAGKSTILKTMRQSIQPLQNAVTLNGIDIQTINALDYYKTFATVDQVGFIFNGTLRENITLHQDVSDTKINDALKAVHLDNLDLDMLLFNNGSNVSGGQRARILSARALCMEASIIVCDEIFAALDGSVAKQMEYDFLMLEPSIVNVSHIYFEENLPFYDTIYKVENGSVERVTNIQTLVDGMLEQSV